MRRWIIASVLASFYLTGCNGGGSGGSTTAPAPTTATPTFSPTPGTFTAALTVTLSDSTPGASIYYSTNGSTPSTSSTLYSKPITVSATTTINAIAVAAGYSNSAEATGTYTMSLPAAAMPTFSPAPGTFATSQAVALSDATSGAAIFYTTDGSAPTTTSQQYSSPISVTVDTTIEAIATATGYSQSATATGTYTISGPTASVVLSTHDQRNLLTAQPDVTFTATTASAGDNIILVDENQQYQSMEGFGAAFTDSAAYLLKEVAQPSALTSTMSDLFTRNGGGIGLSFMRNPMGASDLSRSVYSFDDMTVGQTDPALAQFSIAHDEVDMVPIILQAKALNPQMKILANPWSPPGWMKDPTSMSSVSMLGGTLLMTPANETSFANYFVKYIQAYEAAGVPIDYISLQNEPLNVTASYPSMGMDAASQLTVLRDYILPALTANNLTSQVLVYDHNWDTATYPETVLNDPTVQASNLVAGTAWHGYGGTPGAQQTVQNIFPTMGTWETEHSGGTWVTDQFTSDFVEITQVLRNAAKSYVKWSLALDENLGPNLMQDVAGLGGCNTCTPIVTVNRQTGAITKDIEYYTLGHYSKYALPGAVRIYSSNSTGVVSVAFKNPDGSKALVAFNSSASSQNFKVQWGTQSFAYTLPSLAAGTFTWAGAQSGTPTIPAGSVIQGSSYTSESGLQTETTSDTSGGYDLGYISSGAYAVYNNVDFGASLTKVNVREASNSSGGATAKFYLDSPTGTPIATVTLPDTGGWQNWQTVSAPVSGASGVHNLYVVFTSGANMNWFQFQ